MNLILLIITMLAHRISLSDDYDGDTLKHYLSKSEIIVTGKIVLVPPAVSSEGGSIANYSFHYQILEVIKGEAKLKGTIIQVSFKRFSSKDIKDNTVIKDNSEHMLFLKERVTKNNKYWTLADMWFGIQPINNFMRQELIRTKKIQNKAQ